MTRGIIGRGAVSNVSDDGENDRLPSFCEIGVTNCERRISSLGEPVCGLVRRDQTTFVEWLTA